MNFILDNKLVRFRNISNKKKYGELQKDVLFHDSKTLKQKGILVKQNALDYAKPHNFLINFSITGDDRIEIHYCNRIYQEAFWTPSRSFLEASSRKTMRDMRKRVTMPRGRPVKTQRLRMRVKELLRGSFESFMRLASRTSFGRVVSLARAL